MHNDRDEIEIKNSRVVCKIKIDCIEYVDLFKNRVMGDTGRHTPLNN